LEAVGVDNCRIEIENLDDQGDDVEVRRLLNVNLLIDFACEKINLDYRMY
jgi:hypothetical protein